MISLNDAIMTFDDLWDSRAIPSVAWDAWRVLLHAHKAQKERADALEWLVEVQDFYMHRLRNPGGWAPVGCDRGLMPKFWARRENSNTELRDSYKDARAHAIVN